MCLEVKQIPANEETFILSKGYKLLRHIRHNKYLTPYQGTLVPGDGWLLPLPQHGDTPQFVYYGQEIHGGLLHYYHKESAAQIALKRLWCGDIICECYAFGTVAYDDKSAACHAMYIRLPYHTRHFCRQIEEYMDGDVAKSIHHVNEMLAQFPALSPLMYNTFTEYLLKGQFNANSNKRVV